MRFFNVFLIEIFLKLFQEKRPLSLKLSTPFFLCETKLRYDLNAADSESHIIELCWMWSISSQQLFVGPLLHTVRVLSMVLFGRTNPGPNTDIWATLGTDVHALYVLSSTHCDYWVADLVVDQPKQAWMKKFHNILEAPKYKIFIIGHCGHIVTLCRWSAKRTIPLSVLARNQTKGLDSRSQSDQK